MSLDDYRYRMTVELTEEQHYKLNRILPHGMKKLLFQALVDGVIELHNKGGNEAISGIIGRYIDAKQIASVGTKKWQE
jgi:hypothetical protein